MSPEAAARVKIDALLVAAGWVVQQRNEINLSAARGIAVVEAVTQNGEADYLRTTREPWTLELRLVRTIDARCLGTVTAPLTLADPEPGLRQASRDLLALLHTEADYDPAPPPPLYHLPTGADFGPCLLRLEQLLAVRCSGMDGVPAATFLSGTREILDGNLQLCLNQPDNVVARLILVQTLQRMKKVLPDVVQEYREKVLRLQREKPLPPESGISNLKSQISHHPPQLSNLRSEISEPSAAPAVIARLLSEVYP